MIVCVDCKPDAAVLCVLEARVIKVVVYGGCSGHGWPYTTPVDAAVHCLKSVSGTSRAVGKHLSHLVECFAGSTRRNPQRVSAFDDLIVHHVAIGSAQALAHVFVVGKVEIRHVPGNFGRYAREIVAGFKRRRRRRRG